MTGVQTCALPIYTSGLVTRDHNSEPLAQLSFKDGRFEGQSSTGEPITLSR